jgi:hypothetical protein
MASANKPTPEQQRVRFDLYLAAALTGILANSERFRRGIMGHPSLAPDSVSRDAYSYAQALQTLVDAPRQGS